MNLLEEKWLPVRRKTGRIDWIAPCQIVEDDILAFAANRPDFNGALAQMMVGLLQTTSPVNTEGDWEEFVDSPPNTELLQKWFTPVADAFILDGDGARFMQDFSLAAGTECAIDALLIDAAGGSTIDKNTDHFVKRDIFKAMCPHCAATALMTLQTNAPAGGAGNRTSLRGGGPLTTLVVATPSRSLWHDLWLNVKPQRLFLEQGGDAEKKAAHFTFPWLADITKIQTAGDETQPLQTHPHHVFWAMPRRIRLDFASVQTGQCDICKRESTQLIHRYLTRPQGLNYKGPWHHPFSPYYETKEGWLPVHPQPDGFSYKHWLSWVMGTSHNKKNVQAASIVNYVEGQRRNKTGALRLWVFGYDMDNMKPRCWYETRFPLYQLTDCDRATQKNFHDFVKRLIESAEQAIFYLRQAVKLAWFGDSDLRGDLSFVDKAFWDGTEPLFYRCLEGLIRQAHSETGINEDDSHFLISFGEAWLSVLAKKSLHLFDVDIVGAGSIAQQNPRRIAEAYKGLERNLSGKAIKTILQIPIANQSEGSGKQGKSHSVKKNPKSKK